MYADGMGLEIRPDNQAWLEATARRRGETVDKFLEAVRNLIDGGGPPEGDKPEPGQVDPLLEAFIGAGAAGPTDMSERVDELLAGFGE